LTKYGFCTKIENYLAKYEILKCSFIKIISEELAMSEKKKYHVKVSENGPYIVTGGLPLLKQIIEINDDNESIGWTEGRKYPDGEQYALCRCGHSKNHPYCDGC
jgi:CDGSH-type Zn-finger protein